MGLARQEPAKLELKPQRSSDESALEKAIQSPLIKNANLEELKQVLRLVMMKIGLRGHNFPTEEEKILLIEHIITNFGGHSVQEIRLAFEMAMAGKLDIEDIKCYENFSCVYFSMIMVGYRKWSEDAYKSIEMSEPPKQRIFTQEELDDFAREDAEGQYQWFLKGEELRGVSINKAILEKDGLLKDGEGVIDFFKRKALAGCSNIYVKNDK